MPYTLMKNGDGFEKKYWGLFILKEWPEYEKFWQKHVIPLTNRPTDIHFKNDASLVPLGYSSEDICIAQLHYTILRHLSRIFTILQNPHPNLDSLTEIFVRIVGAQDVAFELLERYSNQGTYDPWLSKKRGNRLGSREAQSNWKRNNRYPLQIIRDYRNHLVHGRLTPSLLSNTYYFPGIGNEEQYFDWRTITSSTQLQAAIGNTLLPSHDIGKRAWDLTLDYLRTNWGTLLLP